MRWILTLLSLLALATPTFASDGVLEINQSCAVNTGCFSGDTAGFPVTINGTAGRSYQLTGDLVVPNENTDGIYISTHDIGIDLNNFSIIGTGCVGATTSACRPVSGTGSGIEVVPTGAARSIAVRNGSIVGMGRYGVDVGSQADIRNLRVRWNRSTGIHFGSGSFVSGNSAYQNGDSGIGTSSGGSTVQGNTAYDNEGSGIISNNGSTVTGNTTFSNGGNGIVAQSGSIISGNSSYENTVDGITAHNGSTIQGNSVRGNDGWGLDISSSSCVYRDNTITTSGTTLGTVDGGVNGGGNVCNGSMICP